MFRVMLIGALAAASAGGTLVGITDGAVSAQSDGNGLEEVSVNRFFIDPTAGVVKVEVDITIRNVTSNTSSGNIITRTFFNGYGVVVPAGAENIVATQNGRTLKGELLSDDPDDAFSFYRFDLAGRIFNGESARIMVNYDHTGLPPRSDITWRANSAYTSHVAFGLGDSGHVTIEVLQPAGYEFDEFTDLTGFEASEPNDFGVITHTRSGLDEEFSIVVGLSNDDQLISTPLDVEGVDLQIRSWPGDDEWLDFAIAKVESGLPELEELIGSAWPPEGDFDIRQTVEPYLYGYAGWFDSESNEIAVGEALDADTLYHELAHAWFNGDVFQGRWLGEGFAQVYASEMVERDGDEALEPDVPQRFSTGGQPLTDWDSFGDTGTATFEATEDYGYNTSFWVVQQVADEIGFENLAVVIAAAEAGSTAYPVDGEEPQMRTANSIDWRYMLDYFERIGGATGVETLFRDFIVAEDRFDDLETRRAAIEAYDNLAERVGPWTMPAEIRTNMDRWAFGRASELAQTAGTVLDRRDELDVFARSTNIEAISLDGAADDFVSSDDDFEVLTGELDADIAAAKILVDKQGIVADKAAAAGTTPPALDTEAAGRPVGFLTAAEVADDQASVLDELVAAAVVVDAQRNFAQRVGLFGLEPQDDIDAARSAIVAGDNDLARTHLGDAVDSVEGAEEVGQSRIITAIIAVGVALLLFIVLILALVRRRRRNRRAGTSSAAESGSSSGVVEAVDVIDEFGDGRVDLDEDALAGASLGSVHDVANVPGADPGEAAGTTGVVQSSTVLGDVGDAVLELHEDVRAVVDADSIAGTEVLIDPDAHDGAEQ